MLRSHTLRRTSASGLATAAGAAPNASACRRSCSPPTAASTSCRAPAFSPLSASRPRTSCATDSPGTLTYPPRGNSAALHSGMLLWSEPCAPPVLGAARTEEQRLRAVSLKHLYAHGGPRCLTTGVASPAAVPAVCHVH